MTPNIKRQIKEKINNCLQEIEQTLEENRMFPSVREAGTAPTDSAIAQCEKYFYDLIDDLAEYSIKKGELSKVDSFEEIFEAIGLAGDKAGNLADEYEELSEIDSFVRDNGESKYRYVNTIYEHKPTKRHICIEEQRGVGQWEDAVGQVVVSEVKKKEIIKYEWQ